MLNNLIYFLATSMFLIACNQGQPKDDFPDFTDEQLNKMLKQSPEYHKAMQQQQQKQTTHALLDDLQQQYQKDTNNIQTTFAYAHQLCIQCIQNQVQYCQQSIQLFSKVIEQDTTFKEKKPYYNRMLCYKQLQDYPKALEDLAVFAKHYQKKPIVNHYAVQAELLYKNGDSSQACQALKIAYRLDSLPFDSLDWHRECNLQN